MQIFDVTYPLAVVAQNSETPFGGALPDYVTRYNSTHNSAQETLIRSRGFYDALVG